MCCVFVFFMQKTAYEMRISDWMSDVCSSDLGFLRWRGMAPPTPLQWRNAAITGLLLLGMGNGLVCFAEERVSSGIAAVAVASMPLFAALFAGMYGEWPHRRESIGLAIGFAGVIVLNLGRSEEHTSELQSLMRISYAVF